MAGSIYNRAVGAPISLETARERKKSFAASFAAPGTRTAHFIGRDIIEKIFAQPGCVGVRVYYGNSGTGSEIMFVGTDDKGNDMLPASGNNYIIADDVIPCPPYCAENGL